MLIITAVPQAMETFLAWYLHYLPLGKP